MEAKRKKIKDTKKVSSWLLGEKYPNDFIKEKLYILSAKVRNDQYKLFNSFLKPNDKSKILDVGVSSVETLKEINFFEKKYPHPKNITAASIDEPLDFNKRYPDIKYVHIKAGGKLPFNSNSFDIVVSWATLEHVGSEKQQKFFLSELSRVGKNVFLTTPDRLSVYDPHSELFFFHWLPRGVFSKICILLKKDFWSEEKNFRCLYQKELARILPDKKIKILKYKLLKFLPSHLLVIKN